MLLVAKRKLNETWREAVARRAGELARETECLRAFDQHLAEGRSEGEAAYRALARFDALSATFEGPVAARKAEV